MSSEKLATVAQKAARGGIFLFVGQAVSTVVLAVGIIVVARLLGPSSYGLYTLAIVIPSLLISLSDLGMNSALIRLPARLMAEGNYTRAKRLIRLGFLIKVAISLIAFVICYLGAPAIATTVLNRPELVPYLRIASLMIVFQPFVDGTVNAFIGQDLMQYSAGVQIMWSTLKGTIGPVLVAVGFGIAGALYGYVFALAAVGLTGALILFMRHARLSGWAVDSVSTDLRALLGYGLPLYVAAITSVFLIQYQSIVLAHFASNVEVGNFGATWNFNTFMMILVYPIQTSIFPMFSKLDPKSQRSDLARGFVLAVKYTSLVMIPASVAVMIFAPGLILLTYGSSYTFAPLYLLLLAVVYLLTGISYLVIASFLNGVAETRIIIKMSVVTLVVYLPLAPALASRLGPYGLLIAYIVSNAASTIYAIGRVSRKFRARPDLEASANILFAGVGAAIPTVALIVLDGLRFGIMNLIAGGLVYLVAYLTLVPTLRAVDEQDILNLRSLFGGTRVVAAIVNPVFDYESKLLSVVKRK